MRHSKSTRYALHAAVEMAAADRPVTVAEIAARHRIPETALAKVMQGLVRAGITHGVRGVGGGYVLARPASEITTLDVINVFELSHERDPCQLAEAAADCGDAVDCRLRKLFDEVDELVRCTFESVSLETLVRGGPTASVQSRAGSTSAAIRDPDRAPPPLSADAVQRISCGE